MVSAAVALVGKIVCPIEMEDNNPSFTPLLIWVLRSFNYCRARPLSNCFQRLCTIRAKRRRSCFLPPQNGPHLRQYDCGDFTVPLNSLELFSRSCGKLAGHLTYGHCINMRVSLRHIRQYKILPLDSEEFSWQISLHGYGDAGEAVFMLLFFSLPISESLDDFWGLENTFAVLYSGNSPDERALLSAILIIVSA